MEASIWGFVGTLVGAIVGASASISTTIIANNNASRLQREADSQERKERARAFQRDTLIAVQDSLQDAIRLMMRAHLEDLVAHRKGGEWGKGLLNGELDESIQSTNRKLAVLSERIANDSIRSELKELRMTIAQALLASSENDAEAIVINSTSLANVFMENLGAALREQY